MSKKYVVTLTASERDEIADILIRGNHSAQFYKRARMIQLTDQGDLTDKVIASMVGVSVRTVEELRKRFCSNGFEATLHGLEKNHFSPLIVGDDHARLTALVCQLTPNGVKNWSLSILSKEFTTISGHKCSPETIRRALKRNKLKPWTKAEWCIPPTDPEKAKIFVECMETILDIYHMKPKNSTALVCMDESSKQLLGEVRERIPMLPGVPEKYDTEYVRLGTAAIFMFYAPWDRWRRVDVLEHRRKVEWAQQIKKLVDVDFPNKKIMLVCDNLNTHNFSSLYATFPKKEADRIAKRIEIYYTPVHGSWLNQAEIELSVLSRTGLNDRISSMEQMKKEARA
jgi:transposase